MRGHVVSARSARALRRVDDIRKAARLEYAADYTDMQNVCRIAKVSAGAWEDQPSRRYNTTSHV